MLLPEPALGLPIGALRKKGSQAASNLRLEHASRSLEGLIAPYTPRRCSQSSASLPLCFNATQPFAASFPWAQLPSSPCKGVSQELLGLFLS